MNGRKLSRASIKKDQSRFRTPQRATDSNPDPPVPVTPIHPRSEANGHAAVVQPRLAIGAHLLPRPGLSADEIGPLDRRRRRRRRGLAPPHSRAIKASVGRGARTRARTQRAKATDDLPARATSKPATRPPDISSRGARPLARSRGSWKKSAGRSYLRAGAGSLAPQSARRCAHGRWCPSSRSCRRWASSCRSSEPRRPGRMCQCWRVVRWRPRPERLRRASLATKGAWAGAGRRDVGPGARRRLAGALDVLQGLAQGRHLQRARQARARADLLRGRVPPRRGEPAAGGGRDGRRPQARLCAPRFPEPLLRSHAHRSGHGFFPPIPLVSFLGISFLAEFRVKYRAENRYADSQDADIRGSKCYVIYRERFFEP